LSSKSQKKQQIRNEIRRSRQQLSEEECLAAGYDVSLNLQKYFPMRRAVNVACYLASDGEVSLTPVIELLWKRKKKVCLPVLFKLSPRAMYFAGYDKQTIMLDNLYGIPEPATKAHHKVMPFALDIVLMPLVAFDRSGNRLGMGGGFYDRYFSFINRQTSICKPKLIGVAHDFQEVTSLESEPWDVPLDAIVTETRLIRFTRR